jgi:hypothetical protein
MVRHRAAGVRERLDAAYDLEDEAARLETVMSIVQSESVPRDDWP